MVQASTERPARPVGESTSEQHRDQSTVSISYLFAAAVLLMIGTAEFLYVFIESLLAVQGVYQWYPQFVAQQWFIYDELFTIFTFSGMLFGSLATALMLSKKNSTATLTTGILCTVSGASVFITSLIAPLASLWKSILNYFLPLFLAPLVGALLFYYAKLHEAE
jgi:hypothetical protein